MDTREHDERKGRYKSQNHGMKLPNNCSRTTSKKEVRKHVWKDFARRPLTYGRKEKRKEGKTKVWYTLKRGRLTLDP
jgi:hypothetical protein